MKLLVVLFITSILFTTVDWKEAIEEKIKFIELNSSLTKEIHKSDSVDTALIQTYTYKNFSKVQVSVSKNLKLTFYKEGNFIFASRKIINLPTFYKGVPPIIKKDFNINESKIYFKNKKIGLEYSRVISGNYNDSRDSLIVELQKLKYDSSIISSQDYQNTHKLYKDFLKFIK